MNDVFDLAKLLFENRAVQVPGVGRIELDSSVVTQDQQVNGASLIIEGVRREFEGGPDAWAAVCAALVELTRPEEAALGTAAPRDDGAAGHIER